MDQLSGGNAMAFAELRTLNMSAVHELQHKLEEDALLVEAEQGLVQAYVDSPPSYTLVDPVYIDTVRCQCLHIEEHHLNLSSAAPSGDCRKIATVLGEIVADFSWQTAC